jgi:hypothetical protein
MAVEHEPVSVFNPGQREPIHQQHRKPTDIFDILLKYAVLKLEKS